LLEISTAPIIGVIKVKAALNVVSVPEHSTRIYVFLEETNLFMSSPTCYAMHPMLQKEDLVRTDIPQSLKSLEYMSMVSQMRIQVFQEQGCLALSS
jgi:hypothetical protein